MHSEYKIVPSLGEKYYICKKNILFGVVQHAVFSGSLSECIAFLNTVTKKEVA